MNTNKGKMRLIIRIVALVMSLAMIAGSVAIFSAAEGDSDPVTTSTDLPTNTDLPILPTGDESDSDADPAVSDADVSDTDIVVVDDDTSDSDVTSDTDIVIVDDDTSDSDVDVSDSDVDVSDSDTDTSDSDIDIPTEDITGDDITIGFGTTITADKAADCVKNGYTIKGVKLNLGGLKYADMYSVNIGPTSYVKDNMDGTFDIKLDKTWFEDSDENYSFTVPVTVTVVPAKGDDPIVKDFEYTVRVYVSDEGQVKGNEIVLDQKDATYVVGEDITFTAKYYADSSVRYIPVHWKVNPEGTWDKAPYTATISGLKAGEYTITVDYRKEISSDGGKTWNATEDYTYATATFKVVAKDSKGSGTGDRSNVAAWMLLILGIAILALLGVERVSVMWQERSAKMMK